MARITRSSRLKTGQELASLLGNYARRVAEGVERQLFGEEGAGEGQVPLERLLLGARSQLLAARQRLMERDDAVQRATIFGREARRQRAEAVREVRKQLVKLRLLVTGGWGRQYVPRILGLGQPTSEDPVVLLRQARQVEERLTAQAREPETVPPALVPVQLRFHVFEERVRGVADALEECLAEVALARQEEEAAVAARREAARAFDEVYRSTRLWLRSAWAVAGMGELAPLTDVDRRRRRPRAAAPASEPAALPDPSTSPMAEAAPKPSLVSASARRKQPSPSPAPPSALRSLLPWRGGWALPP